MTAAVSVRTIFAQWDSLQSAVLSDSPSLAWKLPTDVPVSRLDWRRFTAILFTQHLFSDEWAGIGPSSSPELSAISVENRARKIRLFFVGTWKSKSVLQNPNHQFVLK